MRTSHECGCKAAELDLAALTGPENIRASFREMAGHWRRLQVEAIYIEGLPGSRMARHPLN
jgi:hypothetical protein